LEARHAIIVGASSGIGAELSRRLVARGCRVAVLARNEARLQALCAELNRDGSERVKAFPHDVTDLESIPAALNEAVAWLGALDLVVYSAGVLFKATESSQVEQDAQMVRVNLLGAMAWLSLAGDELGARGGGALVGIGSVAGERGRSASPGYCATKAGLHAYLEGLRGQLHTRGVQVTVIKPGPVKTPMIEGMSAPMVVGVERAAADIHRAIRRGYPEVYIPRRWRPIMAIIRSIPASLFKRIAL
jgi:decaprenylphospho-beta-D-erythro-pentofuranosid-2-ulose 2-reductase